eukprot:Rmarinus@m.7090
MYDKAVTVFAIVGAFAYYRWNPNAKQEVNLKEKPDVLKSAVPHVPAIVAVPAAFLAEAIYDLSQPKFEADWKEYEHKGFLKTPETNLAHQFILKLASLAVHSGGLLTYSNIHVCTGKGAYLVARSPGTIHVSYRGSAEIWND